MKAQVLPFGVNLGFGNKTAVRQILTEDIIQFLPSLATQSDKVLLLPREATTEGNNTVISRILESTSYDLVSVDNL